MTKHEQSSLAPAHDVALNLLTAEDKAMAWRAEDRENTRLSTRLWPAMRPDTTRSSRLW